MKRLSSALTKIKASYDVVVVGSGYGGAIAASRMARANRSVCLLERGREILPGEYPDSPAEALRELQLDLPDRHSGSPTGLFDIRLNQDLNVVVGCGLGGTSLINANVSLEADPRVFQESGWPRAIAEDRGGHLQTGYVRARQMLQPRAYPSSAPVPAKLRALEQSARYLGAEAKFYRPLINVNFVAGRNPVGLEQPACNGCGDCVSGCNTGAKNTVLMNYLPDAAAHGAEIFTEVAVRRLERRGSRWLLYYEPLGAGRERFGAAALFVEADVVLLGAGALGSTEILLRSAAGGLPVSPTLGRRFTGNGDVLGFGYNNDVAINGIGAGRRTVEPETAPGPCITGIIDLREGVELQAGMIIEDGALPGVLAPLLPKALALAAELGGRDTDVGVGDLIAEKGRELDSLVRGAYAGAVNHTQTYLVMSHDDGQGQLRLQNDRLRVHWPEVGRQTVFKRVDGQLLKATAATGGTYVTNPLWGKAFRQDLVTVHPLGGCPMADDAAGGVVNDKGQVFSGPSGTTVHEGLYVCDGATIPRPLGVNPLLTISALAERCCALLAQDRNWLIDYSLTAATPEPEPEPAIGIRFTEKMIGQLAVAGGAELAAEFVLTISAVNLEQLLADPAHAADLMGTVTVAGLSAQPMLVSEGRFNLFEPAPEHPGQRRMRYQMKLTAEEGRSFWFDGEKRIHNDHGFDAWRDLTTLVAVVREEQASGSEVARGTLRIRLADLAQQLQTMEATHAPNLPARLRALAQFGQFFAGEVFDTYGGIFARPTAFAPGPPRKQRPLRTQAPEVHSARTADGVELRLTRYQGGPKGPVLLTHGLGVSSRIFSLDTIDTNLLEYLYAYQYDVWLLDYRASISLPAAATAFTADEVAKQDYPAAVAKILQVTQAPDLQVVAHCFGATTFVMAMLTGLQGVRSAVCSQVAAHVAAPSATRLKAAFRVPDVLHALGLRTMTASVDPQAPWDAQLYDTLLALLPTEREEHCHSAVCHRVSFLYGLLYEHDQLNTATHATLHELFGVANISALEHLAQMVRAEEVVSADGREKYFAQAQRLAIPITFIHGAENHCYLPRSTERTYEELRARNGHHLYRRHVIPNYGHIDCIFGQRAVQDVYPHILRHLEENAHPSPGQIGAAEATADNQEASPWPLVASAGGVRLRVQGPAVGPPVVVFPGMEGSGESCLHLVEPVVQALRSRGQLYQIVLVDYSAEAHESLEALCTTVADLLAGFRPGEACVFWAQSFGNLLAVQVAQDARLRISRFVLGSPFTRLAPVRAQFGTWASAATPPVVFRGTIKPLGRYLFGPTGNNPDHIFFEALYRADPDTVARRTGWLRGRDFAAFFERLPAPAGVWLGQRDRLVERDRQISFFRQLERQHPGQVKLHLIAEAGHVVLDTTVAGQVRDQVREWLA